MKKGYGWKACYDEKTGIYTAQRCGPGYDHLYEITEELFDQLADGMSDLETYKIIGEGRHLYMDVDDRCGPPYTVVFDEDYEKLCPWATVAKSGKIWSAELTDAAVELFESEKKNREQRRKKREEREKSNDANAVKALARFVRKYGKKELAAVLDNLHKKYDFQKIQEILGIDYDEGLKILEENR